MDCVNIAPKLYITVDPLWGDYNKKIVHDILVSIDRHFSECLSLPPFSGCECVISYLNDNPMCCKNGSGHKIFLNVREDYWCQWGFQFAHEYCHHLIAGELTGEVRGLKWFEEVICEVSSLCHLFELYKLWHASKEKSKSNYATSYLTYISEHLAGKSQELQRSDRYVSLLGDNSCLSEIESHPHLGAQARQGARSFLALEQIVRRGWLQRLLPMLSENCYHRALYTAIAYKLVPMFRDNPNLWKIILHFGNTDEYNSLDELLDRLELTADASYSESLRKMRDLLFS